MRSYIDDTLYTGFVTGSVCASTFLFHTVVQRLYSQGNCIIAIRGNKANLTDFKATTGLEILLKLD